MEALLFPQAGSEGVRMQLERFEHERAILVHMRRIKTLDVHPSKTDS
jgi:hypothetical protein